MSALLQALGNAVALAESAGLDYMVIGGYALPHYGRIRTTLDIDIAVHVRGEDDFRRLREAALNRGWAASLLSYLNPVYLFVDGVTGLEVEFWSRPDGVEWDQETLRRRRFFRFNGVGFWVIGPEDYVVSKLARPDRGEQDEMDARSVLQRLSGELDRVYLEVRAQRFRVDALLRELEKR
jgi:predicted nucleotidyltransferase